jgi:hypothetical protein
MAIICVVFFQNMDKKLYDDPAWKELKLYLQEDVWHIGNFCKAL